MYCGLTFVIRENYKQVNKLFSCSSRRGVVVETKPLNSVDNFYSITIFQKFLLNELLMHFKEERNLCEYLVSFKVCI